MAGFAKSFNQAFGQALPMGFKANEQFLRTQLLDEQLKEVRDARELKDQAGKAYADQLAADTPPAPIAESTPTTTMGSGLQPQTVERPTTASQMPERAAAPSWITANALRAQANVFASKGELRQARDAAVAADAEMASAMKRVQAEADRAMNKGDYATAIDIYNREVPDGLKIDPKSVKTDLKTGQFTMNVVAPDGSVTPHSMSKHELEGMVRSIAEPGTYRRLVAEGEQREALSLKTALETAFTTGKINRQYVPDGEKVVELQRDISFAGPDGTTQMAKVGDRAIVDAQGNVLATESQFRGKTLAEQQAVASKLLTEWAQRNKLAAETNTEGAKADYYRSGADENRAKAGYWRAGGAAGTTSPEPYDGAERLKFWRAQFADAQAKGPDGKPADTNALAARMVAIERETFARKLNVKPEDVYRILLSGAYNEHVVAEKRDKDGSLVSPATVVFSFVHPETGQPVAVPIGAAVGPKAPKPAATKPEDEVKVSGFKPAGPASSEYSTYGKLTPWADIEAGYDRGNPDAVAYVRNYLKSSSFGGTMPAALRQKAERDLANVSP